MLPEQMKTENILEMQHICKYYPGVRALDNVDFCVRRGEVHALLGENGAGKSTLIKILAGSVARDGGSIRFDGTDCGNYSPREAMEMGISVIYQELNLVPFMTVEENLSLGKEITGGPFLNKKAMRGRALDIIRAFGMQIDPGVPVKDLSVAYQQIVEILKALLNQSKLMIMDEPSATLTDAELEVLFELIRRYQQQGGTIIYISHRLDEVSVIADRVTVLRDGKHIVTTDVRDTNKAELIRYMVGYEIADAYPDTGTPDDEIVLSVRNLTNRRDQDVCFDLHKGEILGIAGLVGSGRTEIARSLFNADPYAGSIVVNGRDISGRQPRDSVNAGIGLIPEDRKAQGILQDMSVAQNMTLAAIRALTRSLFLNKSAEKQLVSEYVDKLEVKTPSVGQLIKNLSGGNQQKVIIAKWLATNCEVLVFDEPTRGIDVGAKQEIYKTMAALCKEERKSIVMISSELPELIGMCHRIIVMHEGVQMDTLTPVDGKYSQEEIMSLQSGERSCEHYA